MESKGAKEIEKPSAERKKAPPLITPDEKVCFIISPIGQKGTDTYSQFLDVYNYVIKPAIDNSGYKIRPIRADEISRAGSFIKDILENIYTSFIVIADLSGQNPNVFYELGVRHSLSPRTILIAQSLEHIPSDLREYRTIVYDTTARGAAEFAERLKAFLQEIFKNPDRPDNPVLDRVSPMIENRIANLQQENEELKSQITFFLRKGTEKQPTTPKREDVRKRIERILKMKRAEFQLPYTGGSFKIGSKLFRLPVTQGNFQLYFLLGKTNEGKDTIDDYWYLSVHTGDFDPKEDLADIRVLMEQASQGQNVHCNFIVATGKDLSNQEDAINSAFEKMKKKLPEPSRKLFSILIWDDCGLAEVEKNLGLKVEL